MGNCNLGNSTTNEGFAIHHNLSYKDKADVDKAWRNFKAKRKAAGGQFIHKGRVCPFLEFRQEEIRDVCESMGVRNPTPLITNKKVYKIKQNGGRSVCAEEHSRGSRK